MKAERLTVETIPALVRLGRMQVEETLPHLPYEPEVVEHYARWVAANPDGDLVVWLAVGDAGPVGFLAALCKDYLFNRLCHTGQEIVYVAPEYRGSMAFLALMRAFVRWSKERGAAEVYGGVANGFNMERSEALFRRLGFNNVGCYMRLINV